MSCMTAVAAIVYTLCRGPRMRKLRPTTASVLSHGEPVHSHHERKSTRYGGT